MCNLTAIIMTKNEADNIEKCIKSVKQVAKRVVVVDSFSNDNTVDIAKKNGAEVFFHEFLNHSKQFNWAVENIHIETEWIMKIDADEELTSELITEIQNRLDQIPKDVNGIVLKRRIIFMGKWIKHGGVYPTYLLRIFRHQFGYSEMKEMDEHLTIMNGKTITLENDFLDYNNKKLSWWIDKHNWYSDKELKDYQINVLGKTKKKIVGISSQQASTKRFIKNYGYYSMPLFIRAHLYYIYRYYFRLGFLDGKEGKIFHFLQAYWYRFLIDAKIYESIK